MTPSLSPITNEKSWGISKWNREIPEIWPFQNILNHNVVQHLWMERSNFAFKEILVVLPVCTSAGNRKMTGNRGRFPEGHVLNIWLFRTRHWVVSSISLRKSKQNNYNLCLTLVNSSDNNIRTGLHNWNSNANTVSVTTKQNKQKQKHKKNIKTPNWKPNLVLRKWSPLQNNFELCVQHWIKKDILQI